MRKSPGKCSRKEILEMTRWKRLEPEQERAAVTMCVDCFVLKHKMYGCIMRIGTII